MSVDLKQLKECYAHTVGRVQYELGAKPPLGSDSSTFSLSDCSGWTRWALDRAGLTLPDGSANQKEYCLQQELHRLNHYSDVQYAADDPCRLFICYLDPDPIGHVWLVLEGRTLECHGHTGVDSRPWAISALMACSAAFELPTQP